MSSTLETETSVLQREVEEICKERIKSMKGKEWRLYKTNHETFLLKGLGNLPPSFVALDASKPWLVYWCINSLALLDSTLINDTMIHRVKSTIAACVSEDGGVGGGNGHLAHLAPTYAAINALSIVEPRKNLWPIDKEKLYNWLMSRKTSYGGFSMHVNGEVDTRALYCALCVASLCDIITPELTSGCAEWLSRCQGFDGGIAGSPGNEPHGGYTFCALAALCILGEPRTMISKYLDVDKLLYWLAARQYEIEGGFSGRTNKLVDGCYSFWVGGCFPLLQTITEVPILSAYDLQKYIMTCSQVETGGLADKPGKRPDAYHTCYVLSGLSASIGNYSFSNGSWNSSKKSEIYGGIEPIHPVYNIPMKCYKALSIEAEVM
ncbi:hypothetical protein CANCADRAFT_57515 [Tortispora caseinolytica NRRL Y-17796]|uniref:Protein farnesyltransferase subunit beta n=1 Tax=Tortispora caseinolytica NRRL Y-17796 TaxID=767744 RepID=A0A1E4THH0_9ASCO|nr:hypothetical protein CANCADRAFT_57515 [Tortispora caseinolytica NRRL Y-17796]